MNNNFSRGVSVITITNRLDFIENSIENFLIQDFDKKELVLVLNNNSIHESTIKDRYIKFNNIKIYKLDEIISLGECLNFAIKKSNFEYIAKFDDDDYYSSNYLTDSLKYFEDIYTDILGKSCIYIYFISQNTLAIKKTFSENTYVNRVEGSTIIAKRYIFDTVKFRDINLGEDKFFCEDCISNGFKIYSSNKNNYVYIRYGNNHHT